MVGSGRSGSAVRAGGQDRSAAPCGGDHAAHSLHAAVVWPERSGHGRGLARCAAVLPVRPS